MNRFYNIQQDLQFLVPLLAWAPAQALCVIRVQFFFINLDVTIHGDKKKIQKNIYCHIFV